MAHERKKVGEDWTQSDEDFSTTGTLASGAQTVTGAIDASGEITGATIVQGANPVLDASDLVPATIINEDEIVNTGPSAPSSTFAGKLWFDTANNLFKMRNETDDGWLDIWDTASDEPVISADSITGLMLAPAIAGDALVQDGSGNLDVNVDDSSIEINADTLRVKAAGITAAMLGSGVGALIETEVFTSSGTWTKPANCTQIEVWCIGAGGGGGYTKTSDTVGGGGGSGAGIYEHITSALGATEVVTINPGGAGGIASTSTGGVAGGAASFGTHVNAGGGNAGASAQSQISPTDNGGTITTGGDVDIVGGMGSGAFYLSTDDVGKGGDGGDTPFGLGSGGKGAVAAATGVAGNDANGYGAGGGGAVTVATTDVDGGAGAGGIIIVKSYR